MRALDLFCGAGGASMGLHRAGFEVVGVDIRPQPRYPFEFHQGDAMTWPLEGFDLIWASPPCQAFTVALEAHPGRRHEHPDLLTPTRERLLSSSAPWIIENVIGAPMRGIVLCGTMFGLKVYRHRIFECSHLVFAPPHSRHTELVAPVGRRPGQNGWMTVCGHFADIEAASAAMGIDWMRRDELAQAIPPAYSEFIGLQIARALR